jgi:antitoxin (DNA-binding transcriptional repressor) of toxin-antitoxin stability system
LIVLESIEMTQIAFNEVPQRLGELLDAVGRGEEFVIIREGRPVARMTQPTDGRGKFGFGCMRGQITMAADFDEPLEEFAP